jgi:hypothetical protein
MALLSIAATTPLSQPSREVATRFVPNEEESEIERRANDKPVNIGGVNIYKSLINVAGKTTGRIAVSGMIEVKGPLADAFAGAKDISLSAYTHLKQTMAVTPFTSLNSQFFVTHGRWIPSYEGGNPISLAILVEYTSASIIQLTQYDLDLVATAVKRYFDGFGYDSTIRPQVNDAFARFLTGNPTRRSVGDILALSEREENDLQGQQVCANPMDVRSYFSGNVPGIPTEVIAC